MKEIRTIKMIEQVEVKFVADDGKEFLGEYAENECRTYERQRDVEKVKAEFERLDAKYIKLPVIEWFYSDYGLLEVNLNSKADYFAMVDYIKVVERCSICELHMPKTFPYKMTIALTWEDAYEYSGDLKAELLAVLEQL